MTDKKMINFDSRDWDSIRDTIQRINEAGELQFGKTSEGETIIFDVGHDGEGDTLITEVFQDNGWIRKNIYHMYDHSIEELYHKDRTKMQQCKHCGAFY